MNEIDKFAEERRANIAAMGSDSALRALGRHFDERTTQYQYSYNFTWLGRPIIQFPQDIVAMQEIIWSVKPRLVIETGIAHGGSLIFHASMLELLQGDGRVLGIDVDIRSHNRMEIEKHPMFKRITMIEGSSTDPVVVQHARDFAAGRHPVMVVLDSNHTHDHVSKELELYSPLVTKGSYLIVCDTAIEELVEGIGPTRPWGKGNNPMTAVREFLKTNDRFVPNRSIEDKLVITVSPGGYLECVCD